MSFSNTMVFMVFKTQMFHTTTDFFKQKSASKHNFSVDVSSKHQRVNLYYCALDPDGVLKDTRFILVRIEYLYVQFTAAARVIS